MIPLKDTIPSQRVPVVNYGLIAICTAVFLIQLQSPIDLTERLGLMPARLLRTDATLIVPAGVDRFGRVMWREGMPALVPDWLTTVTCIFLHGGWLHLIGNMWFLYIFGDNVEDRLGHVGYGLFYLAAGVGGSLTHLATTDVSTAVFQGVEVVQGIPTVGASGAIAGVMGAYFLLYPKAQVLTLVPIFFILQFVMLPAPVFLGIWFLIQLFQGSLDANAGATGGVAWFAHVGGFAVGLVTGAVLRWGRPRPPTGRSPRPALDHYVPYDPRPPRRPW